MKGEKVYIVLKGKLVEETCTENPLTCQRHKGYHSERRRLGRIGEQYVKQYFDTTLLPEREKQAKTTHQPPHHKRIGIRRDGQYHENHEQQAQTLADKLTEEEKESINYYTGAGYKDILNHIYGYPRRIIERHATSDGTIITKKVEENLTDEQWGEKMEKHIHNMNKAIGLAGEQKQPEMLYRIITAHNEKGKYDQHVNPNSAENYDEFIDKNFTVGETFYRKTITSTTADPAAALSFFTKKEQQQNGQTIIIEYLTKQGARLSRKAGTSQMIHNEYEVILPPYQKYEIVAVHKNAKYTVDARERHWDRGLKTNKYGNITAPNITIVQVKETEE